jgi:pyruvate/2-oxoglutarate dehydrogenase complex dihydrolipoamide acyltransferase (E2) component
MNRPRGAEVRPFPATRRLVTGALRIGARTAPMHGLLDLDVTDAERRLAASDPPLSFTAFVIASAARAAAEHPEVHAYRNWRGRLVTHRHVDISALVEVPTADGPFPLVHTVHDADIRSVADITDELRGVKAGPASGGTRGFERAIHRLGWVPGLIRVMYAFLARSVSLRQRSGTVAVSAVGMFAGGGGFALAPLTLMSLQIVVGGISDRPRAIAGHVEIRRVLDLTVTIDHTIVDGAPAARFGARLRRFIEEATVLQAGP